MFEKALGALGGTPVASDSSSEVTDQSTTMRAPLTLWKGTDMLFSHRDLRIIINEPIEERHSFDCRRAD